MAATTFETDCVRLRLPAGQGGPSQAARMAALRRELESLGDIARASFEIDGDAPWLEVVYFDVRSAAHAKATFGERCEIRPAEGCRALKLGAAALEALDLSGAANMTCLEGGDFCVEFFDLREAARAGEIAAALAEKGWWWQACGTEEQTSWQEANPNGDCASWLEAAGTAGAERAAEGWGAAPPGSEEAEAITPKTDLEPEQPSTPAGAPAAHGPRKVSSLRLSELRWDDLARRREWRRALQLRGLPASLCEAGQLEALLAAHGLRELVESTRVLRSKTGKTGGAVVVANSVEDVPRLAKFFHGSQFGNSMPIAVSFASDQGKLQLSRSLAPLSRHGKSLGEPKRVQHISLSLDLKSSDRAVSGSTEGSESTTSGSPRSGASDSPANASDSERPGLPPGLCPPPGLELIA